MPGPQVRVTPTPPVERWLQERGLDVGCLVELGNPIVEILEPGRPPRRFIPVQGTGLIVPDDPHAAEDGPVIITLE